MYVLFQYKFVDDTVTAIQINKQGLIIKSFNTFAPRLVFAIEVEKPNLSVPFLDVLLLRQPTEKGGTK